MIPTFFGITLATFILINLAPGSPIEQQIQRIRFGQGSKSSNAVVNQEVIDALNKQYGFDKPISTRYWIWLKNLSRLDFGESFTYQEPVLDVILSKFPVSLQFGLASLILTYIVCIPLGVIKALKAGQSFDRISGLLLYFSYSIPSLILGIFLIVFFAGSNYFSWFPIGGLKSDDYESFTTLQKFTDRAHHFVLPLICYMVGSFTELTMVMRNSMLDVIKSDYIRTARAKGLPERLIVFKHALKNSLIPIATGLSGFFAIFLAGSIIIESIFNLDGIGLLAYSSISSRDYNVIMGLTFLSSLVLMFGKIFSDLVYVMIDPRIDFK
ncbi:MAG: ABC transporter permease subunit [Bdellovibrionota bacterium]